MRVVALDDNGKQIEIHPLVDAMLILLVKAQESISQQREAVVELHYVSQTCKVAGKLKHHIGLERTDTLRVKTG